MSLIAAHKGYEYQDLFVACRFVDMLLGNILHVDVDKKLISNDRFDDLTIIDALGNLGNVSRSNTPKTTTGRFPSKRSLPTTETFAWTG